MHIITNFGPLLGRLLVGGMFTYAGITKFMDLAGTGAFIGSVGLPAPEVLAILTAALEVIAGVMLIIGFKTRLAAVVLAVFTVLTVIFFHADWSQPLQMTLAMKNGGIVAALLYMAAHGAGRYAMDNRHLAPSPAIR